MRRTLDLASLVDAVRLATGCVSAARPVANRSSGIDVQAVAIELDLPANLRASGALRGARFEPAIYLRMGGDFAGACEVIGYAHHVLDRHGRELLAFHWHPIPGVPAPAFPHLHVSARLIVPTPRDDPDFLPLDKLHLPTGHVSLPAVVRMLIEEFAVRPLTPTWQARLTEAEATLRGRPDER